MIPKIIHYCWFGGAEKSEIILKCMESWKKYCPDYEIKEWNESNFDVNCCPYVAQAYERKKWAFVSDYCRFYVLNEFGGIYLDTDVELLKPIDFLLQTPFMGFESPDWIAPGLICGCDKGDRHCQNLLQEYEQDEFLLENKKMNMRTVCHRATDEFLKYGLQLNNMMQKVDNYLIYPQEYFNPCELDSNFHIKKIMITDNTVSIHHYAGSWTKKNIRGRLYDIIHKLFGKKAADSIRKKFGKKS